MYQPCSAGNTPNECTDAEIIQGCIIGSKCVCAAGQGKDSPDAECTDCAPGLYAPVPDDKSCMPCDAGKFTTEPGAAQCFDCDRGRTSVTPFQECIDCDKNQFSLPGSVCTACPGGMETVAKGLPFCNCKEGFYFDMVQAKSMDREWYEQGCNDCAQVLRNAKSYADCPGGPKNVVAPESMRRRMQNMTGEDQRYPITGPIIATSGNFVEALTCSVCEGQDDQIDENGVCLTTVVQKTCVNAFACGALGDSCFGLYATVQKEMEDHKTGPKGQRVCDDTGEANTRTPCPTDPVTDEVIYEGCTGGSRVCFNTTQDWCYTMHYIAMHEGIPEDDLTIVEDEAAGANVQTSAVITTTTKAKEFFYMAEDGCDMNYIDAIYRNRQKKNKGVQNFCHVGHEGPLCAHCSDVRVDGKMQVHTQ